MNVKFERFFCFVFEPEYFVKHLEEMALKGWRLKSIGPGWILRYERIAPQRLYYAADVLGCRRKGSEKDRRKDLFTQFCWNYVCSNGMITVYVSEAGKTYDRELENPWSRAPHFLGVLYLLFLIYAGLAVWITRQNYIEITANLYFPLIPAAGAALLAKAVAGTVYYALWRRWKKKQLPVSTKPLYAKAKNFVSLIPHIIMLGALIEAVTGGSLANAYLELAGPLGLRATAMDHIDDKVVGAAVGYTQASTGDALGLADLIDIAQAGGAGAMRSTASELCRWHAALLDGRVLAEPQRAMMLRPGRLRDGRVSGGRAPHCVRWRPSQPRGTPRARRGAPTHAGPQRWCRRGRPPTA